MFTVGYCSVRTKLLKVILKVKLTCPDNLLASTLEAVVFYECGSVHNCLFCC